MKSWKFILLVTCYLLLVTSFAVYSYTQVDLNLTLSSNQTYQTIQRQLTNIGYFNRPLSTTIFTIILSSQTILYLWLLFRTDPDFFAQRKNQLVRPNPAVAPPRGMDVDHASGKRTVGAYLSSRQIWTLIVGSSLILILSYPAFAHDVFNYMFDARTIVKYGQNPYLTTPLDFPQDDWTRFMRWTHVSSAYPPGWILTAIPFYLLGFGKFTLTLLSFKILGLLSFLSSSWLLLKLAGRRAWILWSFNPMVLIESLSSVHNEITMVVFTLLGFNLINRHPATKGSTLLRLNLYKFNPSMLKAYGLLIFAGLIKYTSFLLLPFLNHPVRAAAAAWVGALAFFFIREVNPWYILLPVAISFLSKNKYLTSLSLISSLFIMYRYYPCVAIFSC